MTSNNQNQDKITTNSYLKCILISTFIGLTSIWLCFMISHVAMRNINIPLRAIEMIVILIGITGSFISGYIVARLCRKNGMVLGLICGITIYAIMMISNMINTGNNFGFLALIKLVAIVLASSLGGIIGVNKRKKRK